MSAPIPDPKRLADPAEVTGARRLWAAVALTRDREVCRSILLGRPVLARQLDAEALRRARRGEPLPSAASYIRIRAGHLDAVAEAGPFNLKATAK